MPLTATAMDNGTFHGFMPEVLTRLFHLWDDERETGEYVVISTLPQDEEYEAETCVFASDPLGGLNVQYYLSHGTILDLPGDVPAAEVLALLGYELAPVAVQ